MPDVYRLLHRNVSPHGNLQHPLQPRHDQHGIVVLAVDDHLVLAERLDIGVRAVRDARVGLRHRFQFGVGLDRGRG